MNYKLLIIGVLIGGLAIIGGSIYTGYTDRDLEVTDNAFNESLHYDHMRKLQQELGWQVDVPREAKVGVDLLTVRIEDSKGRPVRDTEVEVKIARRGANHEERYPFKNNDDGRYSAAVQFDEAGTWDATAVVGKNNDIFKVEQVLSVVK